MSLPTAPIHFTRHAGLHGFRELEADWLRLSRETVQNFLQHPVWSGVNLLTEEADPSKVVFFAAREGDRLTAVVPLKQKTKSLKQGFRLPLSYRSWEIYHPNEMGLCDVTWDPRTAGAPLLEELVRELRSEGGWDLLELLHLPQHSNILQVLQRSPRFLTRPSHASKYLDASADYDAYMARFSSSTRHNRRRKLNKLNQLGDVRFEYVTDRRELPGAFEQFLKVEDSGWKGRAGTSIVQQPVKLDSYRRLLEGYDAPEQTAVQLLRLDERCIAASFSLNVGGSIFILKSGYDEEYRSLSPGVLLDDQILREGCRREEISRISFVTGASWMDVWRPDEEPVRNAYHFRNNLKGNALGLAMRSYENLKSSRRQLAQEQQ